jgi:hypothetical protein
VIVQIPQTAEEIRNLEASYVKDVKQSMCEDNSASELRQARIEEEESFAADIGITVRAAWQMEKSVDRRADL